MTANYSIDTGDGNQLTTGLQGYDHARRVAQRIANERAESVYLYEIGDDEPESEEIEPTTARCECGAWSGVRCDHVGPASELVTVEYMPEQHRASHEAGGNSGVYPHNGARRILVSHDCAINMVDNDGDWCRVVAAKPRKVAPQEVG